MKNIEKYKDIVLDNMNICDIDTLLRGKCTKESRAFCEGFNCNGCRERFIKWLLEEYKEPILDDAEKAYLSAVIKPFRNRVNYIMKEETFDHPTDCPTEFIHIDLSDGDITDFPNFKANTMYRGMELDKSYTLQELGL